MKARSVTLGLLVGGALVAGCAPDWDLLDPSLGGSSTVTSGGHGGGSTTSGTGTGGTGGTGTMSCAGLDDGKECTLDSCVGGVAKHAALAAGIACSQSDGKLCNGAGDCVQCLKGTDCPGMDDDCTTRTCDAGSCGLSHAAAGTPLVAQTTGDCRTAVCDGSGGTTFLPHDTDLPLDGKQCTNDVCQNGVASNPPVAGGTVCTDDGGKVCDGKGACVSCLADADCGTSSACAVFTCSAGKCPANPNLAITTACTDGMGAAGMCDGAGSCFACPATTTFSGANQDGLHTALPSGGLTTSSIAVAGLTGATVGVAVTVSLAAGTAHSGDLSFTLVSPAGTQLDLTSRNGGVSTNNFTPTTFDDGAAERIFLTTFTSNVDLAAAVPERNLSKLMGEAPNGSWQLQLLNSGSIATATLSSWSLSLKAQDTSASGNPPRPSATLSNTTSMPTSHTQPITSTVAASGLGSAIYKATVTVHLQHTRSGNLTFSLLSPAGKAVLLSKNEGGNTADVFASTTFDDAAPLLLGCTGTGCAPTNAAIPLVVPEGSLSSLVGDDPNGTWTLTVTDAGPQTGTLVGWSLALTPVLCPL